MKSDKLELRHLTAYLPYGLKVRIGTAEAGYGLEMSVEHESEDSYVSLMEVVNNGYTPVLRPLSDLTKEISNGVGLFKMIEEINIYDPMNVTYLIEQIKTGLVEVIVWNMLLENHFDVFGLIDKGLATDINTL